MFLYGETVPLIWFTDTFFLIVMLFFLPSICSIDIALFSWWDCLWYDSSSILPSSFIQFFMLILNLWLLIFCFFFSFSFFEFLSVLWMKVWQNSFYKNCEVTVFFYDFIELLVYLCVCFLGSPLSCAYYFFLMQSKIYLNEYFAFKFVIFIKLN